MRFTKMQGCGNDFLIFDPGEVERANLPDLAVRACDRHFGVGADGILIPAPSRDADREMVEGEALTIATGAGVKKVLLFDDGSSRVNMEPPHFDTEVMINGFRFLLVSMGNPHAVAFLEDETAVEMLDLPTVGPPIEENPIFPEKTNVEFGFARNE